jgi:flagellar hook-associated protein 3 FlgL
MQVSTSQFFRSQSEQLQNLQEETGALQKKIATGRAIDVASEDPIAFSDIGRLQGQISNVDQYMRNIMRATEKLAMEDNVLTQSITTIIRIQELAIFASNATVSVSDRKSIAKEVGLLSEMLLDLANTRDASGSSLFGGFVSQPKVFTSDNSGNVIYHGDDNQVYATIGDGVKVNINATGEDTFMRIPTQRAPNGEPLFKIVKDTLDALSKGQSPLSIGDGLKDAINHLTQSQTITGTKLSRLSAQEASLESFQLSARSILSGIEDTNIEEVVTQLKQKLLSLEASQASFIKITELSLFNYLR